MVGVQLRLAIYKASNLPKGVNDANSYLQSLTGLGWWFLKSLFVAGLRATNLLDGYALGHLKANKKKRASNF
jgi:hypothetical protein